MESSILFVIGLSVFVIAYFFYGEHLSKKVFNLFSLDEKNLKTPAFEFEDGIDYVPANKNILFAITLALSLELLLSLVLLLLRFGDGCQHFYG